MATFLDRQSVHRVLFQPLQRRLSSVPKVAVVQMERFNCIFSLGGPYLFTCHCKRSIKPLLKSTARFEDCWKKKVQQGPQLWQTVLNQNSINKNNNYDITIMEHFQFFVSGPTINPHSSRLNNFKFLVVLAKPWFTVAHL